MKKTFSIVVVFSFVLPLFLALTTNVESQQPNLPPVIRSAVDISPDSLNLKSKGKWVTAYIELPEGHNVSDIDVATILLNETVPAEMRPVGIGDEDNDGVADLMVKFDRINVISYLLANVDVTRLAEEETMAVTLAVNGELEDGTPFQGEDAVIIILHMPSSLRFLEILELPTSV